MTSVNTNASATTALRTLQATNKALDTTQNRISTGLKIGEAKDNAAYWAISTTLKSDNKSLATVKDALGLGTATVDIAYQGLTKTKEVLDEIKAKLTAATQDGVDRNVIQTEIAELQKQLVSIASSSVFSGENWLSVDSSNSAYSANKTVVSSFARDANGGATIGTIGIDTTTLSLFDANVDAAKSGIVDARVALTSGGRALAFGGTAAAGSTGNTTTAGLVVGTDAGVTATALQDSGVVATKGEGSFTGFTSATFAGNAADGVKFSFSTIAINPSTGVQVLTPVVLDVLQADVAAVGNNDGVVDNIGELVAAFNTKAGGAVAYEAYADGSTFKIRNKTGGELAGIKLTSAAAIAGGSALGLTPANTTNNVGLGQGKLTTTSLNITGLGATDKVQFSFKFDGGSAQTYDVAKGADLDALIVNLNAATGFSTYAVASKSGTELVITGKTLGADKTVELTNVTYTDTLGAPIELATATNLPYSEKAKLTSGAFGGPITLDADDKIQFDIAVGGAASKLVTIDKATVDAALLGNTGTIGTAANYVTVLNKALANAGVTGVAASIETVGVDAGKVIFTSTARGSTASLKISDAAATKGATEISVDTIDISASTLAGLGADSGDKIRQVISAYVSVVNTAIGKVTTAASNLGAVSKQIETQSSFVDTLMDTIDKGVGDLIDADLSEESTRLQALQTKQQLGVQALSIANSSSQNILRLFQ